MSNKTVEPCGVESEKSDIKVIIESLSYLEGEARREGFLDASLLMRETIVKMQNKPEAFTTTNSLKEPEEPIPVHPKIQKMIEILKKISEMNDVEFEKVSRYITATRS